MPSPAILPLSSRWERRSTSNAKPRKPPVPPPRSKHVKRRPLAPPSNALLRSVPLVPPPRGPTRRNRQLPRLPRNPSPRRLNPQLRARMHHRLPFRLHRLRWAKVPAIRTDRHRAIRMLPVPRPSLRPAPTSSRAMWSLVSTPRTPPSTFSTIVRRALMPTRLRI